MKMKWACFSAALLALLAPAVCSSQDFSADVLYMAGAKAGTASASSGLPPRKSSRIYVSNEKMRLETRGSAGTILIVNGAEHSTFTLVPATKEYEPLTSGPSEYFRVTDAENACPDWQKAAAEKIDCEKVGREVVNGRQAVKYKNRSASEDATSAVWIDLGLKFVVKWESAATGVELHNILEAQQAADLFTVPPDYEMTHPRKGTNKGFSNRGR